MIRSYALVSGGGIQLQKERKVLNLATNQGLLAADADVYLMLDLGDREGAMSTFEDNDYNSTANRLQLSETQTGITTGFVQVDYPNNTMLASESAATIDPPAGWVLDELHTIIKYNVPGGFKFQAP